MTRKQLAELGVRLLVPIVSLVVLALVAELLLQVVIAPLVRPRFTRVDSEVGWTHYPSVSGDMTREGHEYTVSYNRHGYRWPEHSFGKTEGVFRIAVLGDSFTDGAEVDDTETFTWSLQNRLEGVEVVNLGVYAYTTAQEVLTWEREGVRYDPDLVILITLSNDYAANMLTIGAFGSAPRFVLAGDSIELQGTDHPEIRSLYRRTNLRSPGMDFLHRHSHVYYLLNKNIFQKLIAGRIQSLRNEQMATLDFDEQVELYLRQVRRLHESVRRAGADLWVVFAWERKQVLTDEPLPFRQVPERLVREGFTVLDLYDDFRARELEAQPRGESLFWEQDVHWNPAGHEAVASLLAPRIEASRGALAHE